MIQFLEKYAAAIIGITFGYFIYRYCGINYESSKEFIAIYNNWYLFIRFLTNAF